MSEKPGLWARFVAFLSGPKGAVEEPKPMRASSAAGAPRQPFAVSLEPAAEEEPVAPFPATEAEAKERLEERLDDLASWAHAPNDRQLLDLLGAAIRAGDLDLPRLPDLAAQLGDLSADSAHQNRSIAEVLSRDQDVTARIMQLANAPTFGSEVRSLSQGIGRLGVRMVRQVAFGTLAQAVIYRVPGYQAEAEALRESGFRGGVFAATLVRAARAADDPEEAFLAGLFHDVGQAIAYRALGALRTKTRGGVASEGLVRLILDDLHVPLGVYFGRARNLPDPVVAAIAGHHDPMAVPADQRRMAWIAWAYDRLETHAAGLTDRETVATFADHWLPGAPPLAAVLACFGADVALAILRQDARSAPPNHRQSAVASC